MSIEALLNTLKERLKPFDSDKSDIGDIQNDILNELSIFNYIDNIKYIISLPEDKLDLFDDNNIYIKEDLNGINIKGEILDLKEEIRNIQKTDPNFENKSSVEEIGIKCFKLRKLCVELSSKMIFNIFKQNNLTAESFIENLSQVISESEKIISEDDENEKTSLQNIIEIKAFKDKFIEALDKSNLN